MITFDAAMGALDAPEIAGLNTGALDEGDVLNLILQRSEIIRDQPRYNRYVKAWTQGDDAPMLELIDRMGRDLLVRRAAAYIYLEYLEIRPHFEARAPRAVADIGCGYALFDLFLGKDFGAKLSLIDLESNENRHFGFKEQGAAYSSLKVAKALLIDNGVPEDDIKTFNPVTDDLGEISGLDYAFSFISCGFHYPWDTYREFFQNAVVPDGRIIVDFRSHKLADALEGVSDLGFARFLQKAANNTADRVMIAKAL